MEFSLVEKFILMSIDLKKGKFLIDTLSLNYGIAGAILLELSDLNKIHIKDKRITVQDKKLTGHFVLDASIKLINNSRKKRKTKFWVNKLGNKASGFRKHILSEFKKKGIINTKKSSYIWGLINIYRYFIVNSKIVTDQKTTLRKIVLENEKPDIESLLLLSLMKSCKLTRVLFISRKDHRAANKRIKEITQNIEISDAVGQALKEVQAAVVVATTSAFIGASSN